MKKMITMAFTAFLITGCLSKPDKKDAASGEYGKWNSSEIGGGGYLLNTIFSKSDPNVIYCNSDVGGIFKSVDKGKSWKMIHGGVNPALCNARSIDVDPRDSNVVLAAIGDQWMAKQGVYLTLDGGDTWEKVRSARFFGNGGGKTGGNVFARDPENLDKVYFVSKDGLFVSADNGKNWKSLGLAGYLPLGLIIDKTNSQRMWFSAREAKRHDFETKKDELLKGGFYKSEDAGKTWDKLLPNELGQVVQPDFAKDKLYAIFKQRYVGVSSDLGRTWEKITDGMNYVDTTEKPGSNSHTSYRALGEGPDFLLLCSTLGDFYRLEKDSKKWERIDYNIHYKGWFLENKPGEYSHFGRSISSITVDPTDPDHWLFTDWFAIYQSKDAGKNWHITVDGVEMTVIHTLVADPSLPGKVFLGMADNALMLSYDAGETFKMLNKSSSGNTKSIAFSEVNPMRAYCTGPRKWDWQANALRVSLDGGKRWSICPARGLKFSKKEAINTVILSPKDEFTLYVAKNGPVAPGKGGVYKSTDGGKTFTWDSKGISDKDRFFRTSIWRSGHEIAIDKSGESMVAISQRSQTIYYRSNDGEWQESKSEVGGAHYSVIPDPFVEKRFYLASKRSGFYRSDDAGKSWYKLYDGDCLDVACDPVNQGRLAISLGKEEKIFLSDDSGTTFTEVDNKLPNRKSVKLCFSANRLLAGTDGNGVFYIPLNPKGEKPVKATPRKLKAAKNLVDMNKSWTLWPKGKAKTTLEADILKVENLDSKANTSASQVIKPKKGYPINVRGSIKTTDLNNKTIVAVQGFDKDWKQTHFLQIHLCKKNSEWQKFNKTIYPPKDATYLLYAIIQEGKGEVSLKGLKVSEAKKFYK